MRRIFRGLVKKIVIGLEKRREEDRGNQPLMIYSCFLGKNVEDTMVCERCKGYHYCERYLKAVEIKEEDIVKQQFLKSVKK
jgi:hypothetical protein